MQPVTSVGLRDMSVAFADEGRAHPRVPGYSIQRKLGQGGMASVYLANQASLDRPVSIKVMARSALQEETWIRRFEHEAHTIAQLSHPGIVGIFDVGRTDDGRLYYSMPYLPNGDLTQRDLIGRELCILDLLRTLLSALEYAHSHGIVHRDVKPDNVLFDADNRPLLTDFGISLTRSDSRRITNEGMAVGSSAYMAPEQARGDRVDGRADLYSVGVLAFELLTGNLPFRSSDPLALAIMHAQREIPRLPHAKSHWQIFIDRTMAKSPDQRFATAREALQALDRISRRSGNDLPKRALRTLDRTAPGDGWKRPRLLALLSMLLLATVLYDGRDKLPALGRWVAIPVHFSSKVATASLPIGAVSAAERTIASNRPAAPITAVPARDRPLPSAAQAGDAPLSTALLDATISPAPSTPSHPATTPAPAATLSSMPSSTLVPSAVSTAPAPLDSRTARTASASPADLPAGKLPAASRMGRSSSHAGTHARVQSRPPALAYAAPQKPGLIKRLWHRIRHPLTPQPQLQ
jgi:serine/threonine-protein kinase PpkA